MLIWFKSSAGDKPCWCWLNSLATESSVVLATDRSLCFEDIGAAPIWVFNNGSLVTFCLYSTSIDVVVLYKKHLMVSSLLRGDANSTWGSVGALIGRQEPFELKKLHCVI
ncbi:unnamed protein product [Brassica oleracea var. botrytis]